MLLYINPLPNVHCLILSTGVFSLNHTASSITHFIQTFISIMGGCVSSPKDLALNEGEEAPVESPNTPKNAEGDTVAEENKEGGENESEKKEEPLVDLSQPKEENVEAKAEEAEATTETKEPEKEEAKPEEAQAEQPKAEDKSDEPLVTL